MSPSRFRRHGPPAPLGAPPSAPRTAPRIAVGRLSTAVVAVAATALAAVAAIAAGPAVAALAVADPLAAASSPRAAVAARDAFSGPIVSATGTLAGASGRVKLALAPGPGTGDSRRVVAALDGRVCRRGRCRRLSGRLRGRLVRLPNRIPDVGQSFTLTLGGVLAPLGTVSATGTIHGTGFIARGHELLALAVHDRRGSLSLSAQSALVPGFTSP